ncbi:hypothetical protein [Streptomyces sp. NPDC007088]|uniref:hypothetical protein n=1 Tax=Streptomyces sp. NPDC007088 TaxID=3364773 RepID=UPI00369C9F75
MTILLARSPAQYLAAALARPGGGGREVPALDVGGAHVWPRRIAARLGHEVAVAGAGTAEPGEAVAYLARHGRADHLVLAVGPGEFAYPAAVFALAKGARLAVLPGPETDAVCAALAREPDARYVTLAGPSALLSFRLTAALRARFPAVDLGVLCAGTVAALSDLVCKTLTHQEAPAGSDVFLAPLLKGAEPLRQGRLTVYPQDAVDPSLFADRGPQYEDERGEAAPTGAGAAPGAALDRPLHRVFSLLTHGSEDYLRLTSGDLLCGLTGDPGERAAALREPTSAPACLRGDGCVYPRTRRWDPASVPAQIVFVNACLTVKLGTQLFGGGERFTVGRRFLDAWAGTYVASPLLKDGSPAENLLFHQLLDEGLSVAAAVRVVNDNLRRWGVDAPEILVFGDPEAVYASPPPGVPDPAVRVRGSSGGGVRIEFTGELPARVRVPLPGPETREAYRAGRLRITAGAPFGGRLPVYGALGEVDGELSAFVLGFRTRPLDPDGPPCAVTVTGRPQVTDAERIVRAVERYDNLASLDIRLDKTRSVLADAANSLPAVARRTRALTAELTQSEPLHRATARVLDNCARLDRHLLDTLLRLTETREYHFVEAYRPTYAVCRVDSPHGACPYCGEALYRYHSAHVLRPALRRLLLSCPVCGAVQDTEDDSVRLRLSGPGLLVPGRSTEVRAELANDGAAPLDVLLGARITRGRPYGFGFRLEPDRLRVDPGTSATARLTVTTPAPLPPGAVRHTVLLRLYAVGMGRIDFAGRDLRFGEPPGGGGPEAREPGGGGPEAREPGGPEQGTRELRGREPQARGPRAREPET